MSKCSKCENKCAEIREIDGCPECGRKGISVPYDTVMSLTKLPLKTRLKYNKYFLCTNRCCETGYYSDEISINQSQLIVPLWFKNARSKFMVCYCRNICLDDVVWAVKQIGLDSNINSVIKYLNKENIKTNCLYHMPTGENCDKLFLNAIQYAKGKLKEIDN